MPRQAVPKSRANQLAPALEREWSTRGYYGSISHNVKAIYQRYMGWFDGNPARLWPHPPKELAQRYVAAIGGIDRVVEIARKAYDQGDYRWAATLLDHAVFVDQDHPAAVKLYADTLEQLGYGSENGTWRNFFLSGASELRKGNFGTPTTANAPAILEQLSPEQIFDAIAITVDGPRAWDLDLSFSVDFNDVNRSFRVTLRNGVLIYEEEEDNESEAQLHLSLSKLQFLSLLAGETEFEGMFLKGNQNVLTELTSVLDPGDPNFNIVIS